MKITGFVNDSKKCTTRKMERNLFRPLRYQIGGSMPFLGNLVLSSSPAELETNIGETGYTYAVLRFFMFFHSCETVAIISIAYPKTGNIKCQVVCTFLHNSD